MGTASGTIAKNGNCCGGERFQSSSISGATHPLRKVIAELCQKLWPTKTDYELAYRIGSSDRACREIISGRATISTENLAKLIRSEDGLKFVAAIMGNAKPQWWVGFEAHTTLQNARKKALLAEQEIREAINAVDETAAALARCESALVTSDEAFHRPQIDALRSMVGVSHRTGAAPARRG